MTEWSKKSREIVAEALRGKHHLPAEEKRKILKNAYPFGPREHWPYKAWCRAVRDALGLASREKTLTSGVNDNQPELTTQGELPLGGNK